MVSDVLLNLDQEIDGCPGVYVRHQTAAATYIHNCHTHTHMCTYSSAPMVNDEDSKCNKDTEAARRGNQPQSDEREREKEREREREERKRARSS